MKLKYLTIEEARQDKHGSLWVQNSTMEIDEFAPSGGDVFLSVTAKDGKTTAVTVPLTWIPVDATLEASKEALLESTDFRQGFGKGYYHIIDDASAQEILNSEEGQREVERIKAKTRAVRAAISARGITSAEIAIVGDEGAPAEVNKSGAEITVGSFDEETDEVVELVTASFKAWVNACNAVDEDEAVSRLRSRRKFQEAEVNYMAKMSKHKKIANWSAKQIASLK